MGLANIGLAQDIVSSPGEIVYLDDFSGSMSLSNDGGTYLLFHKVVGDSAGIDDGYSRIGLRAKIAGDDESHIFGELHTLITDQSRIGVNAGGGVRWMYDGGVAGISGWYDNYESELGNRYQQITFGGEYMHPTFDLRANAYIPINERENFVDVIDPGTVTSFYKTNLVTAGTGAFERSFAGWDAEVGTPVPVIEWLRAYAGMYNLNHDGDTTWGASGRFEARIFKGGSLNVMVSDDDKYGTNVNLGVEVRFSGGMPTRFGQDFSAYSRRYDQVRRKWPVHVNQELDDIKVPLLKQGTTDALEFLWVDHTAGAGGDGSFESPFRMLPDTARGSDVVLVRAGTGDTGGNLVMTPDLQLFGEGKQHYVNTDRLGVTPLPAEFANSGNRPTLIGDGTGDPVITLASGSHVSSFNFDAINAISGDDITDFHLECLSGDVMNGIHVDNGSGTGIVRDIAFDVRPGGDGVVISNTGGAVLNLDLDDITTTGGDTGVVVLADNADINYSADNINVSGADDAGFSALARIAQLNGTVNDLTASNNGGHGVLLDSRASTGTTTFNNLTANGNGIDGLHAEANTGSVVSLNIIDSNLSGNTDDNLDTDSVSLSTMNVFVDPTTLASAGDNAWEFLVQDGSTLNGTFLDVNMMAATNDAVDGVVRRNGTANLIFSNVNGSGAGTNGIDIAVSQNSDLTANIADAIFSGAGNNGFELDVTNNSDAEITLDTFSANRNGQNGFEFDVAGGPLGDSSLSVTATNSDFFANTRSNIDGSVTRGTVNLDFTNVDAHALASNGGVVLDATNNGRITSNWNGGRISNTQNDGVRATADGSGSSLNLAFDGVTIDNNRGDGISQTLTNGNVSSTNNLSLTNSSVTGNRFDGVDYAIDGNGATGSVNFANTATSMNGGDGFQFDVTDGAVATGTASGAGNDFSGNGSNGVQGTVDGIGSSATINIDTAMVNSNGEEGVLLDVDNGGNLIFNLTGDPLTAGLSQNGNDGLLANVDNGSTASINLTDVNITTNGFGGGGSGDGFAVFADNASTIDVTLNPAVAFNNREKGFSFTAENGSNISVLSPNNIIDSTFNGEEGLFFDVLSGSTFSLNASNSDFSNNGLAGSFSGVRGNVDGAGSLASVSFDTVQANSNTQDGFEFTVSDGGNFTGEILTTGAIRSSGSANGRHGASMIATDAGTVANLITEGNNNFSNNGGSGLFVSGDMVDQLAVQASGSFSGNFDDGITISSTDTAVTAIEIDSAASGIVSNNVGEGVDIFLDNTDLQTLNLTTLSQVETVGALDISGLTVSNNGSHGVNIVGNNITVTDGSINNVNADGNLGDGIRVAMTDSTLTNFAITENGTQNNLGNGINVDLTGSTVNGLDINDNTGASSNLGISFLVDGDTSGVPFSISNISDPGFDITNITWDISPTFFGPVFNTMAGQGQAFEPANFTEFFTGLTTVNGVATMPTPAIAVPDDSQLLSLGFNDFNPGESFDWLIDLDGQFGESNVFGDELQGSTVVVDFSNGGQVSGQLGQVLGNPDAAEFVATNMNQVPTGALNNGENGIRVNLDDTIATDVNINNNRAIGNTENGIEVIASNGTTIDGLNVTGNTTNTNGESGINISLDDTMATDIIVTNNTADQNTADGILFDANASTVDSLNVSNSTVTNSGGRGVAIVANDTPIDDITLVSNNILDSMGGDGLLVDLTNSPVVGTVAIQSSSIENSAGHGINLDLDGSAIGTLDISDNDAGTALPGGIVDISFSNLIWTTSITNNSSAGLDISSFEIDLTAAGREWRSDVTPFTTDGFGIDAGDDLLTGLTAVNGVLITPGTDPLEDDMANVLAEGGVATGSQVLTFDFNDFDPGETFGYSLSHSDVGQNADGDITGAIGTVTLSDGRMATAVANNSFGFDINQSFVQTFGGLSSNAGNGININAINASDIGNMNISNNQIQDNGVHGVEIVAVDSELPGPGAPITVANNIISEQANGDGFRMINPDTNGNSIGIDFTDNTFENTGGTAINLAINDDGGGITSTMSGNTIDTAGGFGIRLDATETTAVDLTIGDSAGNANTITNATDAGIGVSLTDNVTATMTVVNTNVSDTSNGADADFNGEGLSIQLTEDATLTNLQIGDAGAANTSFNTNASHGVHIAANLNSSLIDPTIDNITSTGNTGDGINISRRDASIFDNVTIANSMVNNNADGIDILAAGGDTTDEYDINNNTIDSNTGRGIALRAEIDADIDATIDNNTISNNGSHGIELTEATIDPMTDSRSITAAITNNDILDNTGNGIDVQALHDLTIDGNTIDGNNIGINIAAPALAGTSPTDITNNMIINNTNAGISNLGGVDTNIDMNTISGNGGDGIELVDGTHTINNNTIENNGGDGLEAISSDGNGLMITADNNDFRLNSGRGVNLLVSGSTLADLTFTNSLIEGNALEGFYFVSAASTTQSVDAAATTALASNGSLLATPEAVLNFDGNTVRSNGAGSPFTGGGLVMRIGTSGALNTPGAYEDDGGFASDGLGFTTGNLTGRGGVLASITNSVFTSNPGSDVLFESFNSTVAPPTTTGTWDALTYDPATYTQDPLARFDLNFTGNTGDDSDVVRAGATFTNAEGTFKSRLDTATPAGPFASATRSRSGQNLAARGITPFGNFTAPGVSILGPGGDSDDFLFSGVGESTFRVSGGSSTAGFMGGDDFIDTVINGAGGTGEVPFGWGTF